METKAILKGLALGAAMIAAAVLAGCSVTLNPDGSRTYRADPITLSAALRAIPVQPDK